MSNGSERSPVIVRLNPSDRALLDSLAVRMRRTQADTIRYALHILNEHG